jgi:hypothetical protein
MIRVALGHESRLLTDSLQLPHNGPCPVLKEMQNTNLSLANPVVEMDVIGHNITLTFIPTYSSVFGSANVVE